MKASVMAAALFCVAATGCGSPQSVTLETNQLGLKGTVLRDHPMGAEVVASQKADNPPGTILVEVNEIPVRGAVHARELLDVAESRGQGVSLTSMPPPDRSGIGQPGNRL